MLLKDPSLVMIKFTQFVKVFQPEKLVNKCAVDLKFEKKEDFFIETPYTSDNSSFLCSFKICNQMIPKMSFLRYKNKSVITKKQNC